MGRENESFVQKERQLKEYEMISGRQKENDTRLAYRDMNIRFLSAEKEHLSDNDKVDISRIEAAHKEKKLQFEAVWHKNTTQKVRELKQKAPKKGSEKTAEYYAGYQLKELEVFLKNNDRGGNSDEYNAVATDLELYNRVMESADAREGLELLLRLQESCNHYLSTRTKPFTSAGKIRRAIISQVSFKVEDALRLQRDDYLDKQKQTLASMREEVNDETVSAAFKAHYNLVYQVLNGNMVLSQEEMEKLDSDMEEVLGEVKKQKVGEGQSKTMSSKFFNALGWSSSEARIIDEMINDKNLEQSPHGKVLYHSINPLTLSDENGKEIGKAKNAVPQALQLAGIGGKNMYYGIGRIGKGCYTAARSDHKKAKDEDARKDSWGYSQDKGAVMMSMMLNEHARIVSFTEMSRKKDELKQTFPKIYQLLHDADPPSGMAYEDYLTMMAALFGYNTITAKENDTVDYLTTTDRKALTISSTIFLRDEKKGTKESFEDLLDIKEQEEQEEQKNNIL